MSDKDKDAWDNIPSLNLEMDEDYTERLKTKEGRRHHRADITTLKEVLNDDISSLSIRIATVSNGVFDGLVLDLSESGCRVALSEKLKKGELAKVGFIINQRTIVTKAIVRWISLRDHGCSAGLEFEGISDDLKELLGTISSASMLNNIGKID